MNSEIYCWKKEWEAGNQTRHRLVLLSLQIPKAAQVYWRMKEWPAMKSKINYRRERSLHLISFLRGLIWIFLSFESAIHWKKIKLNELAAGEEMNQTNFTLRPVNSNSAFAFAVWFVGVWIELKFIAPPKPRSFNSIKPNQNRNAAEWNW